MELQYETPYPLSPFDLLSSFILAGPFGLVLGTQWAQQPTPRFDARAISGVTQYGGWGGAPRTR